MKRNSPRSLKCAFRCDGEINRIEIAKFPKVKLSAYAGHFAFEIGAPAAMRLDSAVCRIIGDIGADGDRQPLASFFCFAIFKDSSVVCFLWMMEALCIVSMAQALPHAGCPIARERIIDEERAAIGAHFLMLGCEFAECLAELRPLNAKVSFT